MVYVKLEKKLYCFSQVK